jgi:tRNA pseudouridine13 synthase
VKALPRKLWCCLSRFDLNFPRAFGPPPLRASLKATADDFLVSEDLGFEASGSGEFYLLHVEKREHNTADVATALARFARLPGNAVSYAGMKDRHAVTRQYFSVHALKTQVDWDGLSIPGITILSAERHARKLRRGALKGNHFRIRLADVMGVQVDALARLAKMQELGVPNYFGPQRFGFDGHNLELAMQLFEGVNLRRDQRGFALSAARSFLFNAVLGERIKHAAFSRALSGDVWILSGTHSIFGPEPISEALLARFAARDIAPTAPLWGEGSLRSQDDVLTMELGVVNRWPALRDGLAKNDLRQERRCTHLLARDVSWEFDAEQHAVTINFWLPAGCFATTWLHELADVETDPSVEALAEIE